MAATTSPPRRPRTRIRFELDSLEVSDGHVVVCGRWHGVRGLRFVRPTLIFDGEEVLATLEHKPWPADADPWIAEFPWDDGRVDPRRAALSVAPSVTVPLAWPADGAKEAAPAPAPDESVAELQDRLRTLQVEHEALRGRLEEAIRDRETAMRTRARMEAQRDQAFEERNAAERERDVLIAERDGVAGLRDEAFRDREVALHSYRRMQEQLDAARAESDVMESERDRAVAERNSAVAARDEAVAAVDEVIAARDEAVAARDGALAGADGLKAARDEALRARDDLRRRLDETIAEQNALREQIRKLKAERRRETAARRREHQAAQPRLPDPDDDKPIGTRALTAAELLASSTGVEFNGHHETSAADRAAVRLFGTGAFICAFLLVVNLLRLLF